MRSSRAIIAILAIICICSCKEINEKFDKINERLDNLENTTIASINQQIASINVSIGDLEQTDSELREYIASLQETATQLQSSIGETNESIARVENELKDEIASTGEGLSSDILNAKTELLNDLTALRTEMQGKLDLINSSISNLQAADVNLGLRIDQLRTYTDTAIGNAKDWASATFSTLEQYNLTVTEIAGIKANITTINTAISELETRINDKIATDIAQAVSTLEGKLQQQATDITNAYTSAIATAKGEIEAAYTQAIQTAISNSESSMQSWVNDKLTGYYTIAQTDAKLATLKETLESELNSQKEYLEGKITNLGSSLTVKIEANGTLIAGLQTQIDGLSSDLASLAETVAANSRNIAQNAADIATNAINIAANASDIGQCEQLIAANSRLIESNTSAIGENASAITALQSRLATDEQSISTNVTNIAKNAADIAANAEAIATNAAAITNNASAISTNATNIAALQTSLATAITDITTAYNNAISAAITENNGVINAKIAADIATAQSALQQQIDAILTRLNSIENRLDTLEDSVADLIAMVQSIVIVPEYSDGLVRMTRWANELRFEVYPLEAAQELAETGASAFSLDYVETKTKSSIFTNIPISAVSFDGEVISVLVNGSCFSDDIIEGRQSISARLRISDGTVTRSSEYFRLYFLDHDVEVQGGITLSEISQVEDGSAVFTKPLLVVAKATLGVMVYDGTEFMYVHGGADQVSVGDKVQLWAHKSTYRNLPEMNDVYDVHVMSSNNEITYPTPGEMPDVTEPNLSEYPFNAFTYIKARGGFSRIETKASGCSYFITPYNALSTHHTYYLFYPIDYQAGTELYSILSAYGSAGTALEFEGFYMGIGTDGVIVFMPTSLIVANRVVDLGLSVLWSSCNLCKDGFTESPEDYGDYYSWGETETKDSYTWSTYKFSTSKTGPYSKYNTISDFGAVDNKTVLETGANGDDAASKILGGNWRMPTDAELTELRENCTWTWTTQNGVNGMLVTATNGKSIFLPAAGHIEDTELTNAGTLGYYWSSSLDAEYPYDAWRVYFNDDYIRRYDGNRYHAFSIRPVFDNRVHFQSVSDVVAVEDNSEVTVENAIVAALTTRGFVITDGTSNCYVYANAVPTVNIGDKISLKGTKTTYYKLPEITSPANIIVESSNNYVPRTTLVDLSSIVDTYDATSCGYISFTGTLTTDGAYYFINRTDATVYLLADRPVAETVALLESNLNNYVVVTGYYNTKNVPKNRLNIIVTDVKTVAVDMGLSVKWASLNLSESGFVSSPEQYGDYYAWGELEPYYAKGHSQDNPCGDWRVIDGKTMTRYDWESYKWCNGSYNKLTRYNNSSSYGAVDDKTTFSDYYYEDDVARAKLGGKWRIPTDAEWTELREQCTWTWATQNGVTGRLVTATNGNSIFLPAAGYRLDTGLDLAGSYGNYWSSSLNTDGPSYAWFVLFYSDYVGRYDLGRYYGLSVRPVCE